MPPAFSPCLGSVGGTWELCNDRREGRRTRHPAMHLSRHAIGVIFFLGCAALAAQQRPEPSSATALYTAAQAAAGEKIYFEQCAVCHGDDLGGREKATALAGAQFTEAWNGKDLRRLLEGIERMPPTAPKSLSAAQY